MFQRLALAPLLAPVIALLGGCAGGGWGHNVGLPDSWGTVGQAARQAIVQPSVWVPASGALVIGITDLDDNISDWAMRKQPIFGRNAADDSDDLLDASLAVWALSAVLAPADSTGDRLLGLGVQAGTILATGGVSEGLKKLTDRERPNGENSNSLPSGHASQAAVRTHLARSNLDFVDMPDGVRLVSNISLHTLGYATGWARVEANRHYPSDVLAGVALGNFFSEFLRLALFEGNAKDASKLQVQVVPDGAVLKFSRQLPW